jgi:RNA polymerase sigma-70 factor (ECF subfamily)
MSTLSGNVRLSDDPQQSSASRPIDPARLVADHQDGVWRYLRALGCDANEAEDLTQETFLTVLERPFEYLGRSAAAAYLRKVAYHRFVTSRRRSGREIVVAELEKTDESWTRWAGNDNGEELLDALKACLQQLPQRARWALEMRFRDRLQRVAIAERLEISEHGARNLMQRAKQKLRACIESKLS